MKLSSKYFIHNNSVFGVFLSFPCRIPPSFRSKLRCFRNCDRIVLNDDCIIYCDMWINEGIEFQIIEPTIYEELVQRSHNDLSPLQ